MDVRNALKLGMETPFMVIDADQTRRNILTMQKVTSVAGKNLRPHSKTHKIPEISRWEIEEGAVGICVQKVSEAEVMFRGGIRNILISNEVVDRRKTDRICLLAEAGCEISVAVDSRRGVSTLSESASRIGVKIPALIDVDLGMHRCGVTLSSVESFADYVKDTPGLKLQGLMAYDGQVNDPSEEKRSKIVEMESTSLFQAVKYIKKLNGECVISAGGTPTAEPWSRVHYVTELQPGTYVFYDAHCMAMNLCNLSEISMGVVSQVMSKSEGNAKRVVLDAGSKSISIDQGIYPIPVGEQGIIGKVVAMSEEHCVVELNESGIDITDLVTLLPYHTCTTTDYWDNAWLFSSTNEPRMVHVEGRGKRE